MRAIGRFFAGVFAMGVIAACSRGGGADGKADAEAKADADADAKAGAEAKASAGVADAGEDAPFVSASMAMVVVADAGSARGLTDGAKAGTLVEVPGGSYASGSTPGDEGRDPSVEPALVDVTLGAYSIDALPYPNDPALPFKTGASLEEASRLCKERGERLCSELEWEHACKGPQGDLFATGGRWNLACEKERARCASGFGARAMGTTPELTDSRFINAEGGGDGANVLRGGAKRCAARGKSEKGEIAFRCCKGEPNATRIAAIEARPAFKKTSIEPAQLAKIFGQVPELARIGDNLRYFTEGDIRQMWSRNPSASHEGVQFTTSPILWSPEVGAEVLVATGRGKTMSFVVALWTLPGDRYRIASSFLMLNDVSPVALAYETAHRKELHWTSCWGCNGEQGPVSYRAEKHRVVIVQQ